MSYQVFLQGRLVGIEQFLTVNPEKLVPRLHWASLLSEVLPRAVLAELGLSPVLLGSSGADQFLLVIPGELRPKAVNLLQSVHEHVNALTGGVVRLTWASTENLGSWSDIRKRLEEELRLRAATTSDRPSFDIISDQSTALDSLNLGNADTIGWSPEVPGLIGTVNTKYQWSLGFNLDQIPFARHEAVDADSQLAFTATLASSAGEHKLWGVLVANVDDIAARLQLAQSIEEHLQLSIMYKQFFANEVQMLCSQPESHQNVTLLQSGGDNFALSGSWDSLIAIGRELQRLFALFVEANLAQFAGLEGKTISMAIVLAKPGQRSVGEIYLAALERLENAKTAGKDSFSAFGRIIDWKQLREAATSRETMVRLIEQGAPAQFLREIAYFYRETDEESLVGNRHRADRLDRPWRFFRRLNSYLGNLRGKETQRLRTELMDSFTGRRAKQIRLRPQERVALEWANLEIEQA